MRLLHVVTVLGALAVSPLALPSSGAAAAGPTQALRWELSPTGTDARLRGLSAVSRTVAWASGSRGTVLRTVDGGATWRQVSPPDSAALQFRDIEAFDADHAVVLAIGPGDTSRVYVTSDGGATWTLAFRNDDERAFYDCMTFFDRHRGLALSDPVDGKFRILATADGGHSWHVLPTAGMPAALEGEFAFAASGTCLVSAGGRHAWFATGGGARSRVFASADRGLTWQAVDTPVRSGPTAGIYSLAFRDPRHGVAVGGDFTTPDTAPQGAAATGNGGGSWDLARTEPGAYRSGAAWWIGPVVLAVGPTGSDVSYDGGRTWHRFDTGSFDSVSCSRDKACWASGELGRAARLRWH